MKRINEGFKTISEREVLLGFQTMCFIPAGLCSGSLSVNIATVQAIQFAIDGYGYSVAAASAAPAVYCSTAGSYTTASGKIRMFAIGINSAGSIIITPGDAVSLLVGSTSVSGSAYLPSAVATSLCIIGAFRVSCASNQSCTIGGTIPFNSFSGASATLQFWDYCMVPQGVILAT